MFDSLLFGRHLDDEEEVTLIVHQHWLIGLKTLILPTLSVLLPWYLLWLSPSRAMAYIAVGWGGLSAVWWLRNFFDYYLDAWIITDQGVIDLAWHGWFHRESTRVLYSDIQGVSYTVEGITATLLRFGTVAVEKISTGSTFSLSHVPRPRAVESIILQNMEAYVHSKNLKNAKHVQELLSTIVAERFQERSPAPAKKPVEIVVEPEEVVSAKPSFSRKNV